MSAAALWVYRVLLLAALPVYLPWVLIANHRRLSSSPPLRQRMAWSLPPLPKDGVWIQAVSVGEVVAARSILGELRRRRPEVPLVLSATTGSGLLLARDQQLADAVVPFPLDLPGPVRRFLDRASPRLVVLVETELWPETLAQCSRKSIPVLVVNARISDRSYLQYRRFRWLLRPLLRPLAGALAQESTDAQRLVDLGIRPDRVTVAGNVKFDVPEPGRPPELVCRLRERADGRPIWVAGSTVAGEEHLVLEALGSVPPASRPLLLLAPRHPERAAAIQELLRTRGFSVLRRSDIGGSPSRPDVVLLDTVGELAAAYDGAMAAFIGGSLVPGGGHNPIEAARFAVPVMTGPHVRNFEAVYRRFLAVGAAAVVRTPEELASLLMDWLREPERARRVGEAGRALLAANAGATARIVDAVEPFLR